MASRKKEFKPDYYASVGGSHETFGIVYDSLLTDKRFKNLSITARYIYCCCRNQVMSNRSKRMLYQHGKKYNRTYDENTFVFPARDQVEYGFMDRSNFAKYMNELKDAGFIDKIEDNKAMMKPNVYRFSDRWKKEEDVKTRDDNLPQNDRECSSW